MELCIYSYILILESPDKQALGTLGKVSKIENTNTFIAQVFMYHMHI